MDHVEVNKPKTDDPYGSGGTFGYTGKSAYASITSVGMLSRLFLGDKPESLNGGAQMLLNNLPAWKNGNGGSDHPMYYWYYGTLAMFQIGGDEWKQWNEAMKKTLVEHQCKEGVDAGSWPLLGKEGLRGGRVVCTAFGVLSLEVYYRYLKLNN